VLLYHADRDVRTGRHTEALSDGADLSQASLALLTTAKDSPLLSNDDHPLDPARVNWRGGEKEQNKKKKQSTNDRTGKNKPQSQNKTKQTNTKQNKHKNEQTNKQTSADLFCLLATIHSV
jgi:hypothetical protein